MVRLSFKVPIVEDTPRTLEVLSPCCKSGATIHQRKERGLEDTRVGMVQVVRMKCKDCGRTFTIRPQGVGRSSKSLGVQGLAVILWLLGLSYDKVVAVFGALRVLLAKGSAFNYVQRAGQRALSLRRKAASGGVRFVGMDTTVYKVKGKQMVAAYISDALQGNSLSIEFLDKEDAEALKACLRDALGGNNIEMLVSDDADGYKVVCEDLGIKHQTCIAHFKKAFKRRIGGILKGLEQTHPKRNKIRKDAKLLLAHVKKREPLTVRLLTAARKMFDEYLTAVPPRKGESASPEYRMRLLLSDIVEYGPDLFTYRPFRNKEGKYLLDGTNNVTERAIGLDGKIRYRAMRGAKSKRSLRRVINLHAFIRSQRMAGTPPNITSLIA